jgi:hypothetical protein
MLMLGATKIQPTYLYFFWCVLRRVFLVASNRKANEPPRMVVIGTIIVALVKFM